MAVAVVYMCVYKVAAVPIPDGEIVGPLQEVGHDGFSVRYHILCTIPEDSMFISLDQNHETFVILVDC